jgi:predicted component of type VI protein secretion system
MARLDRQLWEALRPLLDRALDLCDTERTEYLNDLRTDSPRVVAALEELLQCESVAQPF